MLGVNKQISVNYILALDIFPSLIEMILFSPFQQASIGANQARLTAQQRQHLALRSMPSPTSVQNSRGAVYSPQSEGNFSPLSPGMVLQSQAQQQQQQQRQRGTNLHPENNTKFAN